MLNHFRFLLEIQSNGDTHKIFHFNNVFGNDSNLTQYDQLSLKSRLNYCNNPEFRLQIEETENVELFAN